MGLGERIIDLISKRRDRKLRSAPGPYGDFYRSGGNELLYNVPVSTGDIVIDAGGYKGEWTATMIARYGCRSEIFEPVQSFADHCERLFGKNDLVRVNVSALGGTVRTTEFNLSADGTSEFKTDEGGDVVEATVVDVAQFISQLGDEGVACLKLNIEGGEYEVLEKLLSSKKIDHCKSLLIQFHNQPDDWELRRNAIEAKLQVTHFREWCFPMIWEKWVRLDNI